MRRYGSALCAPIWWKCDWLRFHYIINFLSIQRTKYISMHNTQWHIESLRCFLFTAAATILNNKMEVLHKSLIICIISLRDSIMSNFLESNYYSWQPKQQQVEIIVFHILIIKCYVLFSSALFSTVFWMPKIDANLYHSVLFHFCLKRAQFWF